MLKKLEELEEKLNSGLEKLVKALVSLYKKAMPNIIFKVWFSLKLWLSNKKKESLLLFTDFFKFIGRKKSSLKRKIDKVISYPLKDKIFSAIDLLKKILLKTPLKSSAHNITDYFKSNINSLDQVMNKLGKEQLAIATAVISVVSIGFYQMVTSTSQIIESEYPNRTPASIQEYAYKPKYKMFQKKTIRVLNVKVPIYRESVREVRSITVDFTVRTSTRFAKQYLEYYENQVKDYFFTSVEPVISTFQVQEEGKEVLKEKIALELNAFLVKNKVEGKVEEVAISFLVAH